MRGRGSHPEPACGDPCRYRQLYESSQTSLADMAAKQARALAALERVRTHIVMLLKRTWPNEFAAAERALGHRMSEATDEVLLAYLEAWTIASSSGGAVSVPAGVASLRTALREVGLPIPDHHDLTAWADTVRRAPRPGALSAAPPGPAAAAAGARGMGGDLDDLFDEPVAVPAPPVEPAASTPSSAAKPSSPAKSPNASHASETSDPLEKSGSPTFAPVAAHVALEEGGSPFDPPAYVGPPREPSPFDDPSAWVPPEAPTAEASVASGADSWTHQPSDAPSVQASAQSHDQADSQSDDQSRGFGDLGDPGDLGDLFEDDGPPSNWEPPQEVAAPAQDRSLAAVIRKAGTSPSGPQEGTDVSREASVPQPAGAGPGAVVRPELFDTRAPTRRRAGRKTKSRATAADLDVPAAAGDMAPVSSDTRSALLAAVAIPRPIFIADLASVAGSREAAESWESEMRSMGLKAPVRLIGGKPRHRMRGSLVLPAGDLRAAVSEFDGGWWAACMEEYHGAKVYEMAVLLHRVGDDVVSSAFDEDVAKLRLNQPRGLVGVVVAVSGELDGDGDARAKVADAVEELIGERLSMVAVLAIRAEDREALSRLLEEESKARGWAPVIPVVVAQSWEWADDAGSSASLVLGG